MKALIASTLLVLLSITAQAKPDCSYNEYGLKKHTMVLAFDRTMNRFAEITAHNDEGFFYFNELRDSSCASVQVRPNNEVRCQSRSGHSNVVGTLGKAVGAVGDWEYYDVHWRNNINIAWKYEEPRGCMFGPTLY